MTEKPNLISKEFSKELLTALYDLDAHLGRLDNICSSMQDKAAKAEFANALGDLIGDIYFRLTRPIYRQHPALGSPDEPGPWLQKGRSTEGHP